MRWRRVLCALAMIGLWSSPAFAVEVQPQRLELAISGEESTRGELTITNHAPHPVQVHLSTGPYRFLQPTTAQPPSAEDWFSFEPSEFTLAAETSATVTYQILPPPSASGESTGEYVAAILVDERPASETDPTAGAQITVVPRFALPAYLTIRGRERMEIEIVEVAVRQAQSHGLVRVETTLRNRGTVHFRPSGTVAILKEETGRLAETKLLGKGLPLFPQATDQIPTLLPLPAPGRYRVVVTLTLGPDQLLQKETRFEIGPEGKVR